MSLDVLRRLAPTGEYPTLDQLDIPRTLVHNEPMNTASQVLAELDRRDLRFYGLKGFNLTDSLCLMEKVSEGAFDGEAVKTDALIRATVSLLDDRALSAVLDKLTRCPLRKVAA